MVKPHAKSGEGKAKPSSQRTAKGAGRPTASPPHKAAAAHRDGKGRSGHGVAPPDGHKPLKITALNLAEKVKELVRLAQEQGYLTYTDIWGYQRRAPGQFDDPRKPG